MDNELKEPLPQFNYISAQAYLEAERDVFKKHKYYQGEIFAMSDASLKHNIIFSNVYRELVTNLKSKNYRPFCK